MSEETIIGPNSCGYCGGDYGYHLPSCDRPDKVNPTPNPQPPLISEEAREAAMSEVLRYNHHQGQNKDRGVYVQQLLNQAIEKLTTQVNDLLDNGRKLLDENQNLQNELARLNGQTNFACECGGTKVEVERLTKENEELKAAKEKVLSTAASFEHWGQERQTLTTRIKVLEAEVEKLKK